MKKLSVHLYGDIGQDVPAAEAVEVEQNVACVACELNAVVCSRGHAVTTCAHVINGLHSIDNDEEKIKKLKIGDFICK